MELGYSSSSRAIAILDRTPSKVEVDGAPLAFDGPVIRLPRGQHIVTLDIEPLLSQR
ncbi:MAG: hypothetical protein WKF37_05180 [Bryobacteraceae bacterium]